MAIREILYQTGDLVARAVHVGHRLNNSQKTQVGGLSIGLAGVGLTLAVQTVLLAFPDREEMAERWAKAHEQDYKALCYTGNEQTETALNTPNRAWRSVNNTFNMLNATGPIGRDLTEKLVKSDTIFCFGPRHKSGADYHRPAPSRDIYFTADDLGDMEVGLAAHLFERRGLHSYFGARTNEREKHYITSAALIWKRSLSAMKAVIKIDATYDMLQEADRVVSRHAQWQDLEATPRLSEAAIAYRQAREESELPFEEARKRAFYEAYHSKALQQETDLSFMQWYKGEVDEQPETRTRSVLSTCIDSKGQASACLVTETYTDYVDPPYYVHSEDIDPATLSALSDVFLDGEPFLSIDDARALINDPKALEFHDGGTLRAYNSAQTNAVRYAKNHFKGGASFGRGLVDVVLEMPEPN